MKINISEINRIKEDLEKEISQRNYTSLRYVLFNKNSKLSHATHLYYENNNYYLENRDERGELIGNPYIFEDFSKAKKCFFEVLGEVVVLNSYYNNTFGEVPYDSPLWSKSSDDVNIPLVSPKSESRKKIKNRNNNRIKNENTNGISNEIINEFTNKIINEIINEIGNEIGNDIRNEIINEIRNEIINEIRIKIINKNRNRTINEIINEIKNKNRNKIRNKIRNRDKNHTIKKRSG